MSMVMSLKKLSLKQKNPAKAVGLGWIAISIITKTINSDRDCKDSRSANPGLGHTTRRNSIRRNSAATWGQWWHNSLVPVVGRRRLAILQPMLRSGPTKLVHSDNHSMRERPGGRREVPDRFEPALHYNRQTSARFQNEQDGYPKSGLCLMSHATTQL